MLAEILRHVKSDVEQYVRDKIHRVMLERFDAPAGVGPRLQCDTPGCSGYVVGYDFASLHSPRLVLYRCRECASDETIVIRRAPGGP